MIKKSLLICVSLIVLATTKMQAQNIYGFTITAIDGQQHTLQEYAGKRIAIVIIPSAITDQDSAFLDSVNALASRYADSITVIAIPSYETGYMDDSLASLTSFYDSLLHTPCIATQGLSTTKTSVYQDPLFTWLTNEIQNGHFNEDVQGIGQSFFIDSTGMLYGVIKPDQPFNDALMQQMLNPSETTVQ